MLLIQSWNIPKLRLCVTCNRQFIGNFSVRPRQGQSRRIRRIGRYKLDFWFQGVLITPPGPSLNENSVCGRKSEILLDNPCFSKNDLQKGGIILVIFRAWNQISNMLENQIQDPSEKWKGNIEESRFSAAHRFRSRFGPIHSHFVQLLSLKFPIALTYTVPGCWRKRTNCMA